MNLWMNDERKTIARQYVHDMVRSFVTEREGLTSSAGALPPQSPLLLPFLHKRSDHVVNILSSNSFAFIIHPLIHFYLCLTLL